MYLRGVGAGAGFNPGAELVLCDLAVVVPAVEQAERHSVLLPDKPTRITKSLQARQGVSCTEREIERIGDNTDFITRPVPPRGDQQ